MRNALFAILLFGAASGPGMALAGWGAIACDAQGSGACGVSYGWGNPGAADSQAIAACRAGGYNCYIYNWEHNMCIHGPNGSWTCN